MTPADSPSPPRFLGGATYLLRFFLLTLKEYWAGVGSALPASSVAKTLKVWRPFFTFFENGEVQDCAGAASSLQVKVPGSSEMNSNVTFFFFFFDLTFFFGVLVRVVSGGSVSPGPAVSTVNDRSATPPRFEAASVALTMNV